MICQNFLGTMENTLTIRGRTMIEYIIYGAIALISLGAFVAISIAKARVGWSFIKEED